MRGDESITPLHFMAAKELAPYRYPKLSAVTVTQRDALDDLTAEELRRLSDALHRSVAARRQPLIEGTLAGTEAAGVAPDAASRPSGPEECQSVADATSAEARRLSRWWNRWRPNRWCLHLRGRLSCRLWVPRRARLL